MQIDLHTRPQGGFAPMDPEKFYQVAMTAQELTRTWDANKWPDLESDCMYFDGDDGSTTSIQFEDLTEQRFARAAMMALDNNANEFFVFILRFNAMMNIVLELPPEYFQTKADGSPVMGDEHFAVGCHAPLDEAGNFDRQTYIRLLNGAAKAKGKS